MTNIDYINVKYFKLLNKGFQLYFGMVEKHWHRLMKLIRKPLLHSLTVLT